METILHLKDEFNGLKSTTFLSAEEMNTLLQFFISVGTRAKMSGICWVKCGSEPTPYEFANLPNVKPDKNFFKFNPKVRRIWTDKGDLFTCAHDFLLDSKTRRLLGGYTFGKYGEVLTYGGGQCYEDLQIYLGERLIFESTSHEYYAAADLDGLEKKFLSFGVMPQLNREIIKKLEYAKPPLFLEGKSAQILLNSGDLTILPTDGGKVIFEFNVDDNGIEYNTGFLGGRPEYTDGKVVLADANPCGFQSGMTYIIDEVNFCTDMQGFSNLKSKNNTFCDLYLELTAPDGRHCDITLSSDYIYVKIS